jgi:glycosyltransferase involved in cell wall biosynthesis
VLLITPEPLGQRMAGPAIRCLELGRALARSGRVGPVVVASLTAADVADADVEVLVVGDEAALRALVSAAGSVVVQGDVLGLHPWLVDVDVPLVVDAYDPFHLEQLEQGRALGEARRRVVVRDATRALDVQLARADLVLCASRRQRALWLGHLAALGRVNPVVYDAAPGLSALIVVVPFGAPVAAARASDLSVVARGVPALGTDTRVLVWGGGIYDWFDPETVIRATALLAPARPDLRLLFLGTKHPGQGGVGAQTVERAQRLAADLGVLDTVVHFHHGWVPYAERDLWLTSAVAGVSAHHDHVETEFSFRTRIVDYLWCRLPVVTTVGDELADRVVAAGAGVAIAEGDVAAYAAALSELLDDADRRAEMSAAAGELADRLAWSRVVEPLTAFCAAPRRAPDLTLGAGDRELLGLRAPRRTTASLVTRLQAAHREGSVGLVLSRLTRRVGLRRRPR